MITVKQAFYICPECGYRVPTLGRFATRIEQHYQNSHPGAEVAWWSIRIEYVEDPSLISDWIARAAPPPPRNQDGWEQLEGKGPHWQTGGN